MTVKARILLLGERRMDAQTIAAILGITPVQVEEVRQDQSKEIEGGGTGSTVGLIYDEAGNLVGVKLTCATDSSVTRTLGINAGGDLVLS